MAAQSGALGRAREVGERAREVGEGVQRAWPVRIILKFAKDRGTNQAVLIAWNFLQSLIPILLILIAVGGYLLRLFGMTHATIQQFIFKAFPGGNGTGRALAEAISGVQQHSGIFALLALLSFLWSSSSLFGTLELVMADAYGIKTRNFITQKLVAFGLMLLFCVLIVVAIGATTATAVVRQLHVPFVPDWITQGATGPLLSAVISVVVGLVLFFVIFWVLPKHHVRPLHALPGAFFSGLMFWVLQQVFPLYLHLNKGINSYGSTFALFFTLLFFFYFLGLITVLGVEINATLFPIPPEFRDPARAPKPEPKQVSRRIPRPVFGVLGGALAVALAVVAGRAVADR